MVAIKRVGGKGEYRISLLMTLGVVRRQVPLCNRIYYYDVEKYYIRMKRANAETGMPKTFLKSHVGSNSLLNAF